MTAAEQLQEEADVEAQVEPDAEGLPEGWDVASGFTPEAQGPSTMPIG